jgi:hypothetical protein
LGPPKLEGTLEQKAINVAKFFRNLEAMADAIKEAEDRMAQRRRALEGRVKWLKDYLKGSMDHCGIQKIDSPWFVLAVQKNPAAVDVYDEAALPEAYKLEVVSVRIDKAGIKRALEAGKSVPGATLTRGTRLAVR